MLRIHTFLVVFPRKYNHDPSYQRARLSCCKHFQDSCFYVFELLVPPNGVESNNFRNEDRKMSADILPTPNSGAMGNPQFLSQGNIPHSLTHTHMHKTESLFPHKVRGELINSRTLSYIKYADSLARKENVDPPGTRNLGIHTKS